MSEVATYDEVDETFEELNVVERVVNLRLVSSAYCMVRAAYSSTKENYPYIRNVCEVAEKGAKTLSNVAVIGSKPIITRMESQIATANQLACKGLDKLESTLPILQQPAEQVVSDTKELVTNAVTSAVSGVMSLAAGAAEGSMDVTLYVATSAMDNKTGKLVIRSLITVLEKSEEWVDHYLPKTDEELYHEATSVDGFEVLTFPQEKDQQSYYIRLGSLSSRFGHRVYHHTLSMVRNAKIRIMENISRLYQTFDLVACINQGVYSAQEKLSLWLGWSGKSDGEQALGFRVLTMIRALTKQLQTICFTVVSSVQGLPARIQNRMQQLWITVKDLHFYFSNVKSLGDIHERILALKKRQAEKLNDYMDDLIDYLVVNTPLRYMVGPFAPHLVERPESEEEKAAKNK